MYAERMRSCLMSDACKPSIMLKRLVLAEATYALGWKYGTLLPSRTLSQVLNTYALGREYGTGDSCLLAGSTGRDTYALDRAFE